MIYTTCKYAPEELFAGFGEERLCAIDSGQAEDTLRWCGGGILRLRLGRERGEFHFGEHGVRIVGGASVGAQSEGDACLVDFLEMEQPGAELEVRGGVGDEHRAAFLDEFNVMRG